jgi:hypothetical protein
MQYQTGRWLVWRGSRWPVFLTAYAASALGEHPTSTRTTTSECRDWTTVRTLARLLRTAMAVGQ